MCQALLGIRDAAVNKTKILLTRSLHYVGDTDNK